MTPASYLTGSLLLLLLHHIAVMKGAVLVAIAASIGNFLQGWDNATIAGMIPIPTSFYASCSFCFYLIMGYYLLSLLTTNSILNYIYIQLHKCFQCFFFYFPNIIRNLDLPLFMRINQVSPKIESDMVSALFSSDE